MLFKVLQNDTFGFLESSFNVGMYHNAAHSIIVMAERERFFDELMFLLFFLNQFLNNTFQHIGPQSRQLLWKVPLGISSQRVRAEQVR